MSCNACDSCPNTNTRYLGTHLNIKSDTCPEGSVAGITKLRTDATSGKYEPVVWNTGDYFAEGIDDPYIYAIESETDCYEAFNLPLIGDDDEIKVTLNCESIECVFRHDVRFKCYKTGVLLTDEGDGGGVQVMSDIDDTIVCPSPQCISKSECLLDSRSVKAFIAGKDNRLEHHEFYPGVGEMMLGLARGPKADMQDDPKFHPTKAIFLSARPREASSFLAMDQSSGLNLYLENVGDRVNMTFGANVDRSMYGTALDGTSYTEMGETKAKSYNDIGTRLPNTRFVFLGDNGQGDVCAAQSMLESDNGDQLVAVLIHKTGDRGDELEECESPEGGDFTVSLNEGDFEGRVHFHSTHSNATSWLLEKELISCCSASYVYQVVEEFISCRCDGECPPHGLPTGFSEKATRRDTLDYCDEIKADQEVLMANIASCPECPRLNPFTGFETSVTSRLGPSKNLLLFLAVSAAGLLFILVYGSYRCRKKRKGWKARNSTTPSAP